MNNQKALSYFRQAMNQHIILQGTISSVYEDPDDAALSYMEVTPDQFASEIPSLYMSFYESERFGLAHPSNYLGRHIEFYVVSAEQDGRIEVSRRMVQEEKRASILKRLKNGEILNARVSYLKDFGVYLQCQGVTLVLRNRDFADDYTSARNVLKIGQIIRVRYVETSKNQGVIFVRPEKLYHAKKDPRDESLAKGQIWKGTVITVSGHTTFVRIMPGRDVLCSSMYRVHKGDDVELQIMRVKVAENGEKMVRGKMLVEKTLRPHAGLAPQQDISNANGIQTRLPFQAVLVQRTVEG